jgi:hypothetical protein
MKNLFLLLLFSCVHFPLFAQKVNYDEIRFLVQNPNSNYYYERLFPRYLVNDTSLTLADYHYLYYGYAFDEDYDPNFTAKEKIEIKKYLSLRKMQAEDYGNVIRLCKDVLAQIPFDTESLFLLASCYENLGNFTEARHYRLKLNRILAVIYRSGDAQTKKTAMYVIYPLDGKMVARKMGFEPSEEKLEEMCNVYKISRNKQKIKGLYFNIEPLFEYKHIAGAIYSKR